MKKIRNMLCLLLSALMLLSLAPVGAEQSTNHLPDVFEGIVMLQEGDSGEAVLALQMRLQELKYQTVETDGQYGKGTAEAVLA